MPQLLAMHITRPMLWCGSKSLPHQQKRAPDSPQDYLRRLGRVAVLFTRLGWEGEAEDDYLQTLLAGVSGAAAHVLGRDESFRHPEGVDGAVSPVLALFL